MKDKLANKTVKKPEKAPLVNLIKRPLMALKEVEKLTQQEVELEVLSIMKWQQNMLHGVENPYEEKLEKLKGMNSNEELKKTIDDLLEKFEGQLSGDKPKEKHLHSEIV